LNVVAGKTRVMEDAFINSSGTGVTDAFVNYLRPLLGSGLPTMARLRHNLVEKILKKA
jgi:ATP-dependent phosphofructokinase / diphosphate-dependent phosphofructokinase